MRKVLKSIGIVVCSCILTATPVMGATAQQVEYMDGEQWKQTVVHMYDRRGNWIADGMLSISHSRPADARLEAYAFPVLSLPGAECLAELVKRQADVEIHLFPFVVGRGFKFHQVAVAYE